MRTGVRILTYVNPNYSDSKSAFPKEYAGRLQKGSTGLVPGEACFKCVLDEEQWVGSQICLDRKGA